MIRTIGFIFLLLVSVTSWSQKAFWENHELVMLFSSQCSHCQTMGVTLSSFLRNYALPFRGLSIDGKGLRGIPSFERVTPDFIKAAFKKGNIVYPATFILERKTLKLYPLTIGEVSEHVLRTRIINLMPKIMQFEKGEGL